MTSTSHPPRLQVIPLPGLTLDTLGVYFVALGLLRLLSHQWPSTRGCWRNGCFVVIGPDSLKSIIDFIHDIGIDQKWSNYGKAWDAQQKNDTKLAQAKKPVINVAHWRAHLATETEALLQQSHLATGQRLSFNPLFGTGGNAGKRLFASGWDKAKTAVAKPARGISSDDVRTDLVALLTGEPCQYLSDFGAGSWFSAANKIYNSGSRKPYSEGQITPWAMLLACEAFPLLGGSASRQLGSQRKATASFPFVTRSTAPVAEQANGQRLAEFWAPVWERPMTIAEVTALYQTGKAEITGKAALTAAAFAAAIIHRGVDSGIQEFRSFTLMRTTSENTFESRLASIIKVPSADPMFSEVTRRALQLRDSLPPDREQGAKKRYLGLQGPIDRALIALSEAIGQGESQQDIQIQVERSWELTDAMFATLAKIDRNKTFREAGIRFELLPLDWLHWLLEHTHQQHTEIRLALALASLRPQRPKHASNAAALIAPQRLLAYRIGATGSSQWWTLPKDVPLRRIWSPANLQNNLPLLARRRLIEVLPTSDSPFKSDINASISDAIQFLAHQTDDDALTLWIDRFSLFDWSAQFVAKTALREWAKGKSQHTPPDSTSLLYGFFRPHFDSTTLASLKSPANKTGSLQQKRSPVAKAGRLASIVTALESDNLATAWDYAAAAYRAERIPIADFPQRAFACDNPRRLLAALVFPVSHSGLKPLITRWLSPSIQNTQKSTS